MIRSRRHDVVVFHVEDPAEAELAFEGSTMLRDLETGEEMQVDPGAIREAYLSQLEEVKERFRRDLTESGIDYQLIQTSQPYDEALWAYLQRRDSLSR